MSSGVNKHLEPDVSELLPRLVPGLRFLARRRILLPILLLLSAQRPLAFVLGQGLWLCSPLELLLPGTGLGDWAALLSHPHSALALERLLEDALLADKSTPEATLG
jgi:hypothetical protein